MREGLNHCVLAVVVAGASALASAVASLAAPVTRPTPTLRITRFEEYHPATGTMMGTAALPPSTGAASPNVAMGSATAAGAAAGRSASIDLGASFELGWRIDACNMETVRITLSGVGDVPTGPRNQEHEGCFWLSGHRAVTPTATTNYQLQASGTPVSGAAVAPVPVTSNFQVIVRSPHLEVLEPRVNDTTLGVTFRARNTGQVDFQPSSITVRYSVVGVQRDGGPTLTQGSAVFSNVSIPRDRSVDLGSVTLGDRARLFSYDVVSFSITLDPAYRAALADSTGSFGHRWATRSSTITSDLLRMIGQASSLEVRLNNYSASVPEAFVANDSFVRLNLAGDDTSMNFSFPPTTVTLRVVGSLTHHTYVERRFRILINQITANVQNRDDFLAIRNGKLAIHLDVPNPGNAEVKIGEMEGMNFVDREAPDVNIGGFPVDITLTPGISSDRTRLTLASSSVEVPPITADLQGLLDELIPKVRETLQTSVHDTVVGQLSGLLARGDVKRAFEDGLGQVTTGLNITRITNLDARGDRITITYL